MTVGVGELYSSHSGRSEVMYCSKRGAELAVLTEKDIVVTLVYLPELLMKIQEAQKPRARELLHKQRRNELKEYEVQAKVLSFN